MALKLEASVFTTVVGTRRDGLTRFFFTLTAPVPRGNPPAAAAAPARPLDNAEEYPCKPELVLAAPGILLISMPQELRGTTLVVTEVASTLLISDAAIRRMSGSGFMPAAK
jgi:hypothetical protein